MAKEKIIRIGGGGGFADDRLDAAVELIEKGDIDYLSFDSLSENELSQITIRKLEDLASPDMIAALNSASEKSFRRH